jgi:methylmalonyl-CoA epimerase
MTSRAIDHIGIAVRSIAAALPFYETVLGIACTGIEEISSQKVRVAFLPLEGAAIELLEPTSPESPIAKFLESRGEGIHHIAYVSESIEDDLAAARTAGLKLIHEVPFEGGHGKRVAFLHPKSTQGVLTEFCEKK